MSFKLKCRSCGRTTYFTENDITTTNPHPSTGLRYSIIICAQCGRECSSKNKEDNLCVTLATKNDNV